MCDVPGGVVGRGWLSSAMKAGTPDKKVYNRKNPNILLRVVTSPHSLNPSLGGFFVMCSPPVR